MLVCFLVFHRLMRKHLALLMDVVSGFKFFSEAPRLHTSVVPAGVTVLLGFCNPPHRGRGELAKSSLLYLLCGFLAVIQLVRYQGREAE
jgi:hypothetical protein